MPEAPNTVITSASFSEAITLGILAGGEGRRVGGADKGLLEFRQQALIAWTLKSAHAQLGQTSTLISANRNLQRYAQWAPAISDADDQHGPLAGIAALLKHCETDWLLTLPCDCPQLPPDFGAKLAQFLLKTKESDRAAVVYDGQRNQNAVLLIRREEHSGLLEHLQHGGGAIHKWLVTLAPSQLDFSNWPADNWNANTTEALKALIEQHSDSGE